jgi:hypothetical protein
MDTVKRFKKLEAAIVSPVPGDVDDLAALYVGLSRGKSMIYIVAISVYDVVERLPNLTRGGIGEAAFELAY